jgi:hypothetical protein
MATIFNRLVHQAAFVLNQRLRGVSVPDQPHFDEKGTAYFVERLRNSHSYLEYGCGGSTVEAARQRKSFVSIESDAYYLRAVREKIAREVRGTPSGQLVHADIGITEEWGRPFIKRKTPQRLSRWKNYAARPWSLVVTKPDLILIDGRFRILCALYSIDQMHDQDFTILFDDYADRPHYHVVEHFARLEQMMGRMAILRPKQINKNELLTSVEKYVSDYS